MYVYITKFSLTQYWHCTSMLMAVLLSNEGGPLLKQMQFAQTVKTFADRKKECVLWIILWKLYSIYSYKVIN